MIVKRYIFWENCDLSNRYVYAHQGINYPLSSISIADSCSSVKCFLHFPSQNSYVSCSLFNFVRQNQRKDHAHFVESSKNKILQKNYSIFSPTMI